MTKQNLQLVKSLMIPILDNVELMVKHGFLNESQTGVILSWINQVNDAATDAYLKEVKEKRNQS